MTATLPAVAEVAEVSRQALFVETLPEHHLAAWYQEIADALACASRLRQTLASLTRRCNGV